MKKPFSERYRELIESENFICKFPHDLKLKLIKLLNDFDEPSREPISCGNCSRSLSRPDTFGEYGKALAFVSVFIIFTDFGLSNYMVQEGSRDESVLPLFMGSTLLMKTFTLLAIYALMLVLMHPSGFNQSIQSMFIVFGLASSLNALDSTVYNYFQAKQQMYYAAIYQFLSTFLIGASTILVVIMKENALMITVAQLVATVLISLMLYVHLRRHIRLEFDLRRLLEMLKKGLPYGMAEG